MIIGINGKVGSGKDTVAKMIQLLQIQEVNPEHPKPSYFGVEEALTKGRQLNVLSQWKVRKFADKLKEIASLLLGVPREKFEDQEFKESVLGEKWRVWYVIRPKAEHPIDKKTMRISHFYLTEQEVKDSWFQGEEAKGGFEIKSHILTVREFLQLLGSEGIRMGVHPNAWVNALFVDYKQDVTRWKPDFYQEGVSFSKMSEYKKWKEDGTIPKIYTEEEGTYKVYPDWLITDVRFPNEAEAIKERGGILIHVNRSDNPYPESNHISETALRDWEFDYTIDNDGTVEELLKKTKDFYETISSI